MYKALWVNILTAFVLSSTLSAIPYRQKVSSKKKEGVKYVGPVIYNNVHPPIVHFPSPPQVPKRPQHLLSRPIKYVPLPYSELPILIYQSKHNPPIHVVERDSRGSVGESSPYHKEYSVESDKIPNNLYSGTSTIKTIRTLPQRSPVRSVLERGPIYIDTTMPKPAYLSNGVNTLRRHRGMYPPGVVHGRPKIVKVTDLDIRPELSINAASIPKFQVSKRYARPILSSLTSNNYINGFISTLLGGLTSTSYNINKFLGLGHFRTTASPILKNKLKEYRLRKALGLDKFNLDFMSGYGNQAIDPEYQSLLSEQITHSFIDEVSNYGSHGMVKYRKKRPDESKFDPEIPWKFEESKEEDYKSQSKAPSTTTPITTTTLKTTTAAPAHTKPPIIIFQGIRPPVYMYKKPSHDDSDEEIIVPPAPHYHRPQVLHEESLPTYKSPPYKKLNFPINEKEKTTDQRGKDDDDDDDIRIISPKQREEGWKPITESSANSNTLIDLKNHRINVA